MKKSFLISLALLAAVLTSCAPSQPKIKHVFLIGLDGMSSYAFRTADMPNAKIMMEEGSYTTLKRSVLPSSSAINWATMFMGAPEEIHGFTTWGSQTPEIPSRILNQHGIYPTIFQLYRDKNPDARIDVLYDWDGIKYLVDTLCLDYYAGSGNYDPEILRDMAIKDIKENKPNLMAVIFDNPDHVGHSIGWETEEYQSMLTREDACLGQIIKAIEEAGIKDESVIILTADHGGIGQGHGSISLNEMETPFIITGPGIKKNFCFDDWSMMQYDCAGTMARILDVELPQPSPGRSVDVIFEP